LSDWEIRYEVQRWWIADQIERGDRSAPPSAAWLAEGEALRALLRPEDIDPEAYAAAEAVPVSAEELFGKEALAPDAES